MLHSTASSRQFSHLPLRFTAFPACPLSVELQSLIDSRGLVKRGQFGCSAVYSNSATCSDLTSNDQVGYRHKLRGALIAIHRTLNL